MASKIRIKSGAVEIEFEGSEEYFKKELPELVRLLFSSIPIASNENEEEEEKKPTPSASSKKLPQMTVNTIASRLRAEKGGDLVVATCACLHLVKKLKTLTRNEIIQEMKLATNHYKKSMSGNLTPYIKTLIKENKLLEVSKDTYSLQANTLSEIEEKLSEN
ncbi:MAG: hypothetical protein OXF52_02750 [Candidatus Dadabacteria bacterium]|nr:hypothetical protein [Candidatus Dadabacteria bacterium]